MPPTTWQFEISLPAFTNGSFSFAADDFTVVSGEPFPSNFTPPLNTTSYDGWPILGVGSTAGSLNLAAVLTNQPLIPGQLYFMQTTTITTPTLLNTPVTSSGVFLIETATTPNHIVGNLIDGTVTETAVGVAEPSTLALMSALLLAPLIQRIRKRRSLSPN